MKTNAVIRANGSAAFDRSATGCCRGQAGDPNVSGWPLKGPGANWEPIRAAGVRVSSSGLAILYARAGRLEEARVTLEAVQALAQKQFVSPYGIASYYAVIGDNEREADRVRLGFV
jgi:hypothetical protein